MLYSGYYYKKLIYFNLFEGQIFLSAPHPLPHSIEGRTGNGCRTGNGRRTRTDGNWDTEILRQTGAPAKQQEMMYNNSGCLTSSLVLCNKGTVSEEHAGEVMDQTEGEKNHESLFF